MSIFASRITQTIEIPFDAPNTVTIRKLAGRHLEKAHEANLMGSVDRIKRMGGPAFQREMSQIGDPGAQAAKIAELQADPMNGYDPYALLYAGITGWTYPEPLNRMIVEEQGPDGAKIQTLRIPSIDDLDEQAVDLLARAILKLSKPGLFQTEDEAKAAQKND